MNQNLFKELASLVPAQLDAGQVFTGTPTGKASKATRKRVRTCLLYTSDAADE